MSSEINEGVGALKEAGATKEDIDAIGEHLQGVVQLAERIYIERCAQRPKIMDNEGEAFREASRCFQAAQVFGQTSSGWVAAATQQFALEYARRNDTVVTEGLVDAAGNKL